MLKMISERSEISSCHSGFVISSSFGIRHWSFAALIVAIMFSSANLKAASAEDSSVIAFPPSSAQKWVLPNGLTIIVQEDRSAPVASVQAWCATGSIDEDAHLGAGLAHILEHMLFKGTKTRSTNEIAQKIQDVGGYINAYTSFDRTVFWIDVPKDGALTALDILADAMMNSTLPPQEYAKEQEVIRREFAMGMDDPDRTITHLLFATAYQRHPYRLPVIGLIDIYNNLTQEQVMEYYKTRYVPNNLTFIVVGDVVAAEVRETLENLFKDQPAKSLAPIYIPPEPPQLGLRKVHQELGLAFAISAFSYTPGDPGLLGVDAVLDPKNRSAAQSLILQIIEDIRHNGVTAEELD